ncbi:MAG: class I SAM-dependent DNA methyltransferase [Phenylobacterium sp.]|uniref:class I SAM-dependent DNA methyltransferase n=1 Tax=Phenylobacterium sp. TaxID=1871053 RepID=UPI002722D8F4|nr:DNA methyltransferase [Phenylobacterium sp.]MDO8899894.1 class I SAM-dependent DNA methyltransferase [Phenylobacterium sp.]
MDVEAFIQRWSGREGGAERANYALFLSELCDVLGLAHPDPADASAHQNDYAFERAVRPRESDGGGAPKRIDLYKRGSFILEAKQSRLPGRKNALPAAAAQGALFKDEPEQLGRRDQVPRWDVMMQNARKQAEGYVFLLDADHPAPPFIITCDVGHCLELYADFTGTGRAYNQFPDRKGFRIFLEDLRDEKIRQLLVAIWTDPQSLDPTRQSARVTREIAGRLAQVSKSLEEGGANPEDVAHFLMRCLFTMFAEDVDLLPKGSFRDLLSRSVEDPTHFPHRLKQLWSDMDKGAAFSAVIDARVRHFNGGLFAQTTAFELKREEIGELLAAARADWREVDPAIFGTLLEQALDKDERARLGAHYTPRSYVQRLVEVTVMAPLRADWDAVQTKVLSAKDDGDDAGAIQLVRDFHHRLCETTVLDPACGTGNFLYVSLELMKKLEGEVLQNLIALGDAQAGLSLAGEGLRGRESVDPHQFLGLELNPRAAAIAELVIWIGYLQWHYRNHESHPAEPILRAFKNINFGRREGYDAVLTWDGYPLPKVEVKDGVRVETYPNPRRPEWPEADFIVGNPPFIGGANLRSRMAPGYAEALWKAHPQMNESADFVMYWWDRAAEILRRKKSRLRRFGFVTTNSISQVFQRRVMERHLNGKPALSLVYAVPDHPWTKATRDSAAVRISMTAAAVGKHDGLLAEVTAEAGLDTDEPKLSFWSKRGKINSDLSVGVDVTKAVALKANDGLCSPGVKLHGSGFIVTPQEAEHLGLGRVPGLDAHIRPYRNGRDLVGRSRGVMVIDLDGQSAPDVRRRFPDVYEHLLSTVKPERDQNNERYRRENWWLFGRKNTLMRGFVGGTVRYVATPETSRHRIFQFLGSEITPDNKVVAIGLPAAEMLSILSSSPHRCWAVHTGGWLGVGNDSVYVKSICFDAFPFPDIADLLRTALAELGEELDATRKAVQAEHPDLTLTGLYNVLEKVKAGAALTEAEADVKARGRVLILKELHEQIDAAVFEAYGWPADLADEQILERLVALNAQRAKEEAAGHVRWLRPDYQIPRFAKGVERKSGELDLGETVVAIDKALPAFPTDRDEAPLAVEQALILAGRPLALAELARTFKKGGKRLEPRLARALNTLVRFGSVSLTPDGRYVARRAA